MYPSPYYNQMTAPDYNSFNYQMPKMPQNYNQIQNNPQNQPQQLQDSGLIHIKNVEEGRSYPIAPGSGMFFKVENANILCTKSLGIGPLDQPVFKVYKLVDVTNEPIEKAQEEGVIQYATLEEFKKAHKETVEMVQDLQSQLKRIQEKFQKQEEKLKEADKIIRARKKARAIEDEEEE